MERARILFAAAAGLASVSPVFAQHYVEYGLNLSLGPIYFEQYRQGAEPSGVITHEEIIPDYGRIFGVANVGFGVNRARVDLAGTNPANPFFFEYGFASSYYQDVIIFDDPELNGTHGFFDATLFVAGSGAVNMSPSYVESPDTEFDAFWHAVINVMVDGVETPTGPVQSVYFAGDWYKAFGESVLEYFGDPLNTYQQTMTFEFIYGQPILMQTFLQLDIFFDNQTSQVGGTLDAVIDLGNSSYWGGIQNLRDQFGNPVTDATYSSSSGFDYRLSCAPTITSQPGPAEACPDRPAVFGVGAASANPISYQWQVETAPGVWQALTAAPFALPCGGSVQASDPTGFAPAITVSPCAGVTAYRVRVVATTVCGSVESAAATFTVQPLEGDADASGVVNFGDISAALASWGNDYRPGTGFGDSDRDGVVAFGDITTTLAQFGATCP